MEIKYTVQGFLIYAAMAACMAAFAVSMGRKKIAGRFIYLVGFLTACVSFGFRWYDTGHVPMQNLFEVFLTIGVLVYPIWLFGKCYLDVGGYSDAADMLINAVVLFPAGFVFSAEPQNLPPALQCRLFVPHVAAYMLAYVFMAKAAFQGIYHLTMCRFSDTEGINKCGQSAYRMVRAGFPLLTAGLILGSIWGKIAWGDYWNWDPKELASLASWLVYVGYFHFRHMFGKRYPRINSVWIITGLAAIIITLLWVNLSRIFAGLHSYAA